MDPRRAARETEAARKLRKVKVEMEGEESQSGSASSSLYTTYFRPTEESKSWPGLASRAIDTELSLLSI